MAKKILVVEDEPFLIEALDAALSDAGFSVETASDGNDALSKITRGHFNLIILDFLIPGKTGIQVLEHMRMKGNETPVIMASNASHPNEQQRAKELGVSAFLVKADTTLEEIVSQVKKFAAP